MSCDQHKSLQIQAIDVDFWNKDDDDMKLMDKEKLFPPARPYTAQCAASIGVKMSFEIKIMGSKTLIIQIVNEFNLSKLTS